MTFARTAPMISFETLRNDLWQSCRQIPNVPGFAGAVILALAAGFGISTTIFSTVRSVLFTPLPYNKPERLVQIVLSAPPRDSYSPAVSSEDARATTADRYDLPSGYAPRARSSETECARRAP